MAGCYCTPREKTILTKWTELSIERSFFQYVFETGIEYEYILNEKIINLEKSQKNKNCT